MQKGLLVMVVGGLVFGGQFSAMETLKNVFRYTPEKAVLKDALQDHMSKIESRLNSDEEMCSNYVFNLLYGDYTPLEQAVKNDDKKRVNALLQFYASANDVKNSRGQTPLKGAFDFEYDNGKTLLMYAAKFGHRDIARLFLDYGADPGRKDRDGNSPIMIAAKWGYENLVDLFLKRRVSVNTRGQYRRTPLMMAAKMKHKKVVALLLKRGADITVKDVHQKNLWQLLEKKGYVEMEQFIFKRVEKTLSKRETGESSSNETSGGGRSSSESSSSISSSSSYTSS